MNKIVEIIHGSKLYGTQIIDSDTDLKFVTVAPTLYEYMDHRGKFDVDTGDNGLLDSQKIEWEGFYIQDFANKLVGMNTNNVSMLFAPKGNIITSSPAWEDLLANRERAIGKNIAAYAGYAKGQSCKYTLKGERLETVERFIKYIKENVASGDYTGNQGKMTDHQWSQMREEFQWAEGFEGWSNQCAEQLIRVVAKSFSKTTQVQGWIAPMESLLSTYGKRAQKAKEDQKDLKAILHACRICNEAIEILTTGELVYPVTGKNLDLYMGIRRNEYSYEYLQEHIIDLLERVNEEQARSTLPETPDERWLYDWAIHWQMRSWRR